MKKMIKKKGFQNVRQIKIIFNIKNNNTQNNVHQKILNKMNMFQQFVI